MVGESRGSRVHHRHLARGLVVLAGPRIPLFKVHVPASVPDALRPIFDSGWLVDGPATREFQRRLGELVGTDRVVTVSDMSAALTLAFYLAGVRPGDEIIVPPMVCTATT